jgi:hypothetical protein
MYMTNTSSEKLNRKMSFGHVYRRDTLLPFSKAIDRDLEALVSMGTLQKLAYGLYYKPAVSSFGVLPPKDQELVTCFLREDNFLLYSRNEYNALGVGLTQLYNRVVVLNYKRQGIFKLGNREYDFRKTNRGFPKKMSPEFLLIDLLNNFQELAEDTSLLKDRIKKSLHRFNKTKLLSMAKAYGKVSTNRFFKEFCY